MKKQRNLMLRFWLRKSGTTNQYLKIKDNVEFRAEMRYYMS